MMLKTWRRIRHFEGLVTDTIRRDIEHRRMRADDAELTSPARSRRVAFDAPAPIRSRDLPAAEVTLRSVRDHAAAVLDQTLAALASAGVPVALRPTTTAAGAAIGIREQDWPRVASLVADEMPQALLGVDRPRAPARARYLARPAWDDIADQLAVHLLSPAVAVHEGRQVSRYGFECAVTLERWEPTADGRYTARLWNPVTETLGSEAFQLRERAELPEHLDSETRPADAHGPFAEPALLAVDFPIDVVYTWVDGTDPAWLERKRAVLEAESGERMTADAAADLRFVGHDELRHSLRSIERYAPWVRHIYLVTDRQRPDWLRDDHPGISVVDHTEIAPPGTALPTFNSQAIEANLHRIEGLSEHFLYFNDDVFLSSHVDPELFFQPNGIASMYMSRAHVAPGAPVAGEPASDSAGKNARLLVREATGKRVSRKLFHTPFALQRSVSQEIDDRWPEVISATRSARLRRIDDVTLSGALHMDYAYATGRAVTRGIRYRYVNVGAPTAQERMAGLEQDRDVLQTFCLNESTEEIDPALLDCQVRSFLARRFPDASSFERL